MLIGKMDIKNKLNFINGCLEVMALKFQILDTLFTAMGSKMDRVLKTA